MNTTFICTLEALKNAAEIHRSVRFRYARESTSNLSPSILPHDAREGLSAFLILHAGEVNAFENICPHRGTELDWNPGDVFDESGLYLICATHGALFEPKSGVCVSGPCVKQRLTPIATRTSTDGVFLVLR